MKIEGALFDLDGTLLQSMEMWQQLPLQLVRRLGGDPPEELARTIEAMDLRQAAEYIIRTFGLSVSVERVLKLVEELAEEEYRLHLPAKPGAQTLLERLRQKKIPCGIVSATQKELSQAAMERLGLWQYFSFALDCEEYGPKTKPHIYLAGAEKLGSRPGCTLVFEDALHGARTAKEAGFLTVGVWDPSGEEHRAEMEALCDQYIERLDALELEKFFQ